MAEEQKPEPKISLPEFVIIGLFIVLIDAIDFIGGLLGLPISDFTDIIAFPFTQLYLFMKGIK